MWQASVHLQAMYSDRLSEIKNSGRKPYSVDGPAGVL